MNLVVGQRSPPGLNAAHFWDCSLHSPLWSSEVPAKSLGFQRSQSTKHVPRKQKSTTKFCLIKADAGIGGNGGHIGPLQPESPTGQFLIELLRSHPHLVSAAVEQQLDKLSEDRVMAEAQNLSDPSSSDLYKRIAALKVQERHKAVEEILYALVSHRFFEAHISMVPPISHLNEYQIVDNWPAQERELQALHSSEALEMVWAHLAFILGMKSATEGLEDGIMIQIGKFDMGQVYATSTFYGYFLRRVDEKFQMEKSLAASASKPGKSKPQLRDVKPGKNKKDSFATEMSTTLLAILGLGDLKGGTSFSSSNPSNLLRNYLISFEADALYRCATIRSSESACIIERHTEALFGKPDAFVDTVLVAKEENMILSVPGLKRLVLEAVAFGSFLWDAETLVDSHYNIVAAQL